MDSSKFNYLKPINGLNILIITLILSMFFLGHSKAGFIFLAVFIAIVIYNNRDIEIKKLELKKFVEDYSGNIEVDSKNILLKAPLPMVIINDKGKILWNNQNTSGVFGETELLAKNISVVIKDVDLKKIVGSKKICYRNTFINEKYFDMYVSNVEVKGTKRGNIILLYFIDINDREIIKKELAEKKEAIVLIEVDNFDEVKKVIDVDMRPLLEAEIERTINSFGQNLEGVMKKYKSHKYILFVQNKYIDMVIEKKFEILDNIREISIGNKIPVTISIGVGNGGETPIENYNNAVSALELALGRGGDQVVVKNSDKLLFFGGKTKEVEKRTKVKARVLAHALRDISEGSSNIFIMGHSNPDVDCFGSAVGLNSVLRSLGKKSFILLDSINPSIEMIVQQYKNEMPREDVIIKSSQCFSMVDENSLLIVVDTNHKNYLLNPKVLDLFKKVVVIDHHRRSPNGIEDPILQYIEPYASSVSELVTEMIQYMKENHKLTLIEAKALLAGITVDTKNFCFKTGVRTFEAAAFLRSQGADTIEIRKLFVNDIEKIVAKAEILKTAVVEKNIAIAVCPPNVEDTLLAAQTADELLNITGIYASFVLVKIKEDIIISGRSLGDINVQLILEDLGGGGHLTMAGAKIENKTIEDAVGILKEAIQKYLREGEE